VKSAVGKILVITSQDQLTAIFMCWSLLPYKLSKRSCSFIPTKLATSGVRRKFPREGQVSSQSCDVTNQL